MLNVSLALALGAVVAACGRANTVYSDGDPSAVTSDGLTVLPTGFYDQSVNRGVVDIATDPDSNTKVLRLRLLGGANDAGAFNLSTATGNRAVLAISKYEKLALTDLSIEIVSKTSTSSRVHASALISLACDGTTNVETIVSDDFDTTLSTADAVWSVSGAEIKDANGTVVLAANSSGQRTSLDDLLTAYPSACLQQGHSTADETPAFLANSAMASLQLSLGGVDSTSTEELKISKLKVNGDSYSTWGRP